VDSDIDALTSPLEAVAHSPEKVVLIGFDLDLMTRVKAEFPQHEVCLVAEQKSPEPTLWLPSIEEIVAAAVSARLDGVSLANTPAVGRPAVDCIHEAGLNCCIWTVSLVEDARRFIDAGVDSLTMDDPRLLEAAD
jgi:glycerophosphoryl diester phosphodiesterase